MKFLGQSIGSIEGHFSSIGGILTAQATPTEKDLGYVAKFFLHAYLNT